MPCLVAILAFFFPRLAIILLVIFSDYIGRAYQNDLWAFLGFLFMPLTTLAYAWGINSHGSIDGIYLVVLIIAVLMDLGIIGGGAQATRARRTRVVVVRRE
jgi:hypothetical protein